MNERVARYRSVGAGADLVRVEVLVPHSGRDAVKHYAAQLRQEHRKPSILKGPLADYYDEAVRKYGARCLWSAKPSKTTAGMKVIAAQLRTYGGMDAWRLATAIRKELGNAAG